MLPQCGKGKTVSTFETPDFCCLFLLLSSLLFRSGCPTLKSLGLYDFILDHSDLQFLTSVNADSEESVLPNLSSLGLSSGSLRYSVPPVSTLFSKPWVNLTSITFADANVETFRAFLDAVNDGKLLNLVELRMSARIGEDVDFGILQPEQVPKLKSLTLAQVVTFSTKLQQLVHQIAQCVEAPIFKPKLQSGHIGKPIIDSHFISAEVSDPQKV